MRKNYSYYLLIIIIIFVTIGVYILVDRAKQADAFFEFHNTQETLR